MELNLTSYHSYDNHEMTMLYSKHNRMPSYFNFNINIKGFIDFLELKEYKKLYSKSDDFNANGYCDTFIGFIEDRETIITYSCGANKQTDVTKIDVWSMSNDIEQVKTFLKDYISQKLEDTKVIFSLVTINSSGYNILDFKVNKPVIDLKQNYGEKFLIHHEKIVGSLSKFNTGLYIISGKPGTGKTTYLKYLASVFPERKFIYLNPKFAQSLDDTGLITCLLDYNDKKPILIIEDAENLIISRDKDSHSPVTTILNTTDGLLSDIGEFAIILTYNSSDNIDQALYRKGRLRYSYVFDLLSIKDAQNKIDSMNLDYIVTQPMSLADIYNLSSETNLEVKSERTIGFK